MKTKFICGVIALLMLAASSNGQKKGFSSMSHRQQNAILDSIAGNPALLQKVNEKALAMGTMNGMNGMNMNGMSMGGDSSMMMGMMQNPAMMDKMMDMMMAQCAKDTAVCRSMCTKMMNNPKTREMMHDMMMSGHGMDSTQGNMNMDTH